MFIVALLGTLLDPVGWEHVAARLKLESQGWSSIEMRVRTVQTVDDPGAGPHPGLDIESRYVETASGKRFYDTTSREPNGLVVRRTGYRDGSRCANVTYQSDDPSEQAQIVVSRVFLREADFGYVERPEPLAFYYVGLVPLHEALRGAERLEDSVVLGRPCDRFLFPEVKGGGRAQALVYHLDRATSVPLKVTAHRDRKDLTDRGASWTWEATSLERVAGHNVVMTSKYRSYHFVKNEGATEQVQDMTNVYTVESVEYDKSYPSKMFWPTFGPGAQVFDVIENKSYRAPGGEPEPDIKPLDPSSGEPIRIGPETNWGRLASWGLIALGIAGLIGCLIALLRRRS